MPNCNKLVSLDPDLKKLIVEKEVELEQALVTVEKWLEYKNKGQHEHAKQIKILEQELEDMQYSFDDMKGTLNNWAQFHSAA